MQVRKQPRPELCGPAPVPRQLVGSLVLWPPTDGDCDPPVLCRVWPWPRGWSDLPTPLDRLLVDVDALVHPTGRLPAPGQQDQAHPALAQPGVAGQWESHWGQAQGSLGPPARAKAKVESQLSHVRLRATVISRLFKVCLIPISSSVLKRPEITLG